MVETEKVRNPKRGSGKAKALAEPVVADGYFRRYDLARRYRISLVTLWSWQRRPQHPLPAPIKLGPNVVGWPVEMILAWEHGLPRARAA
jgi:predicted DNA-binding transcriptional regulator AlpA